MNVMRRVSVFVMILTGTVIPDMVLSRPAVGNSDSKSGYISFQGGASNTPEEKTNHQMANYPELPSENHHHQYSHMMFSPFLQEEMNENLRRAKTQQKYVEMTNEILEPYKLFLENHNNNARRFDNFENNHVVGQISMKVYPPKKVFEVEAEEYLDKTGVLEPKRKDMDEIPFNGEKWAYPSPQVSELQKDELNVPHKFKEYDKPHDLSHHGPGYKETKAKSPVSDIYFVAIVAGCCSVATFGVIAAGICFYRFQKKSKAARNVEYPAYGVTGPGNKEKTSPNGDRKLAHSAQMYHYQHQKHQMISVENVNSCRLASASDMESEEENDEGDYTVYECPGLAVTGEMEVQNPLFIDESGQTVSQPPKENNK
ncbi:uncharacterized protein LOC106461935 [Limulus polyphemus]|uniref:Uncharacterized protein LOC106461935 n=1 Tax=Limulus polyphemus TaxID=6850 RepID=A0ABM1B904_LIMPO|nr:uncharacterized protein LOC106461935 [Limulus polyphemus]